MGGKIWLRHWWCQLNIPIGHISQRLVIRAKGGDIWLRNYLYYSTLIYVFSLRLTASSGLNLGIRPIELNLLLICLLVKFTRISRWILWFLLYLAVSSCIGIANGTDPVSAFFIQYRAIAFNVLYYYYFFRLIRNDSDRAFSTYLRFAYWFAVIAIPAWALSIGAYDGVRLRGFATEPAQFCSLILPAYYWYAHQFLETRKYALEVAVFTVTVILTQSSIGYISVAFGIVLLLSKNWKYVLVAPLIVSSLLGLAYASSSAVRMRVDNALVVATTADLTGSDPSTYSLISNAIVTQQVLKESPIIGNGLGSHPTSHERFLGNIPVVVSFIGTHLASINEMEAASLTLHVLSEFGILGYLGVLIFLFHFHVGGKGPRATISNAILVCFFLKLVRSGEYYQPEQFFYIFIYILNHRNFVHESSVVVRPASSRLSLKLVSLLKV